MAKHVSVRWTGELDFEGADGAGAAVRMSPKPDAFGPAALVLAALAGCTGMDAVSIMNKKRVQYDSYAVEVSGEQREEYPKLFTAIRVEHVVTGSHVDDRSVARAIELSARKYCTVGATLASGDASINHRLRVTDDDGERTCDCITIGPRGKGLSHYEEAAASKGESA